MKIAVLGRGQLGQALKAQGVHWVLGRPDYDLFVPETIPKALEALPFDVLINTAAFTDTRRCEFEPSAALAVNGYAVQTLADYCRTHHKILVQISTDYVFNGEKGSPYTEEDPTGPLQMYGMSKCVGESFVDLESSYIFRTASLFGRGKNHFIHKIKMAKDRLEVIDDIFMSPTHVDHLASWILKALEQQIPFGIYHAVNRGEVSWYELARKIASQPLDAIYNVRDVFTRPQNSSLNPNKLAAYLGDIPSWEEALLDLS